MAASVRRHEECRERSAAPAEGLPGKCPSNLVTMESVHDSATASVRRRQAFALLQTLDSFFRIRIPCLTSSSPK